MTGYGTDSDRDAVLSAVRHPARRWVLQRLATRTRTDLATLADDAVTSDYRAMGDDYRRAYLSLQHVHLPALVDAGLIQFDSQAGEVGLLDAAPARLNSVIDDLETLRDQHESNGR